MRRTEPRAVVRALVVRGAIGLAASSLLVGSLVVATVSAADAGAAETRGREVMFQGVGLPVPAGWRIVDLARDPHACLRFDRPAVYVGPSGDQAECPAHLIGGAPGLHVERLTSKVMAAVQGPVVSLAAAQDLSAVRLPGRGPVGISIQGAGVLVTLVYGPADAPLMHSVMSRSAISASAERPVHQLEQDEETASAGVSVPGDFRGDGFDTCAAPSQAVMDAWRRASGYASVGIYIGGVDMGCAQPNLTSSWVSRQVARGWHLLPVYVGHQAPCSNLANRLSYDAPTARKQGQADATDATKMSTRLGIVAPSTLYSDMEGYDSSDQRCVAAVMSYLSGWTFTMHSKAYQAGVYSSAASGVHDLSIHYDSLGANRPDDLFMAWWNHRSDVSGGRYVSVSQWRNQQRVHQYEGHATETYGGHSLLVDRNFLEVSSAVPDPEGCPTTLDYEAYPLLRWPTRGEEVRAAQCLLASRGFDPGPATGALNWRTAAAVRAFKASRELDSRSSSIGSSAWTALLSAGTIEPLHFGSRGPWVRKVQRALTARLQTTVTINGVFGSSTEEAVRLYQRTVGLTPTGTVGPPTWRALQAGR